MPCPQIHNFSLPIHNTTTYTNKSDSRQIADWIGGLLKAGIKPAENSAAECVALSRTTNPFYVKYEADRTV